MKILKLHNKNKPYLKGILSGLLICFLYFQPLKVYGEDMDAKKARSVFSALDSIGNFYDRLNAASLRNLPAGVKRTLGNVEYSIAISGVKYITGDYAELTIYGRIQIPQGELFFGAQGIKFSHDGDFKDDCELLLLHDMTIPVNGNQTALILHGGFDQITGQLKKMTYFSMDCSGFKELSVVADIVFSDSLIRKVNEKGEPVIGKDAKGEPLGRVSCPFTTVIRDWNDIFVSISMPRFEINGLDGFIFDIKNAVFDFSDSQNEQNIVFPRDYVSNYLISGNINTWRGVYIRELSLVLPRQFAEQNSDRRISFSAQNMLIDNNGISGSFAGENILPIDRGSAGGWRFSVNRFSLDIETNQLTGARFSGAIGLPVSEISTLNYEAFISPGNEYQLKVSSVNDFNFDIWKAKATINANSYIQLKVIDGKFRPEAILNGSLSVSVNSLAKIDDIRFTEMHLQTVAPYFSVKSLGCEGDVSLKGFPLSVSKIALTTVNKEARLGFDAKLSLAGDKTSIAAKTRLEIVSSVEESGKWKYQKLDVTKIILDSVTIAGAFSLNGSLILLNDDPVYGDGFAGEIDLDIKKGIELGVRVRAIFGNKDYRYWLVDGLAEFPGILVFPPAVKLNGFGGGAYYRMKPSGTSSMPTKSGYIPDSNYGLGLKAALLFNIGKKGLVDGESSFEIAFNKNGGINFISFYGQAKFLGEIPGSNNSADFVANKFKEEAKKEADFVGNNAGKLQDMENMKGNDPNKAAQELFPATEKLGSAGLLAAMGIQYDFTNNTLHSTFDIYVNAVNGMLKGIGSGNKAGGAVFHVEPGKWYLHLGTPTNQMGVEFNIANLVSMKTQSYFMAGHDIPGSPPPPQAVADILGVELSKLDYMRDLNALGDGRGLAFGSSLSVATGDITFLILYANFQAGLGFDIMLKDYSDAYCEGRSGPIGIDGWYANGQAYAYLQGELGVNVNLLFVKKKIPVIKGGAATLLQAKLPNPSWFSGNLGVRFDLLGGLIRGSMSLKITLGEECKIVMPGGSPLGVKVISDITPQDKSDKIDVFTAPQVAFNMPVGKEFEIEDEQGIKKYKLKLAEFLVLENNKALAGKIIWNNNNDAASFFSHEILPPNVSLKVKARVTFEEYKNGHWVTVNNGGQIAEESMETTFTTGTAPDVIPMHNIEYCYPVVEQQYFYPKESKNAYIQLKRGQSYLFTSDMQHKVHITQQNGTVQVQSFTYSSNKNRIEYTIPDIATGNKYEFNLLSFASAEVKGQDMQRRTSVVSDDDNEVSVRNAKAGQAKQNEAGKSLLAYNFNTSKYNTFSDKFKAIQKVEAFAEKIVSDVINLQYNVTVGEPFDVVELAGTTYSANKPLVNVIATLEDDYYKKYIEPLIYIDYPPGNFKVTTRNVNVLGVPPAKAVLVNMAYLTQIENGIYNGLASTHFPYIYDLPRIYKDDYIDLRRQIINKYPENPPATLLRFYQGSYPFIIYGYYKITLQYILPGEIQGAKSSFEYYNFFK